MKQTKRNPLNVKIVIYKMHDFDLIRYAASLKDKTLGNPTRPFVWLIKDCLEAYAKGEDYSFPDICYTNKTLPSKICIRFKLDPKKDTELIDILKTIKDRQINSFCKNTIRRYMPVELLRGYWSDDTEKKATIGVNTRKKAVLADNSVAEKIIQSSEKEEVKIENKPENAVEDPGTSDFDFFGALGNIN